MATGSEPNSDGTDVQICGAESSNPNLAIQEPRLYMCAVDKSSSSAHSVTFLSHRKQVTYIFWVISAWVKVEAGL
jgi:hypothetical protein